jgi:hypothetical protein
MLDFLIYQLQPYGILKGLQAMNQKYNTGKRPEET